MTHVPNWPEEARALKRRTWVAFLYAIGDFILVLLPIYFIRKLENTLNEHMLTASKFLLLLPHYFMVNQPKTMDLVGR